MVEKFPQEKQPQKSESKEEKEILLDTALDTYNKTKDEFGHKKALILAKDFFTAAGINQEEFIKMVENRRQDKENQPAESDKTNTKNTPKEIKPFNIKNLPHYKDKEDAEKSSSKLETQEEKPENPEVKTQPEPILPTETPPEEPLQEPTLLEQNPEEEKDLEIITTKDRTGEEKTFKIGDQVWFFDNEGEINYFTIKKILPAEKKLPAGFVTEAGLEFFLEDYFYNKEDAEKKAKEWLKEDEKKETEKTEGELSEEDLFKELEEELKKFDLEKIEKDLDSEKEILEDEEEKKIEKAVIKLPEKERKRIFEGLANIGFKAEAWKNNKLKKAFSKITEKLSVENKENLSDLEKNSLQSLDSVKRRAEALRDIYTGREEQAIKNKERENKNLTQKASGIGKIPFMIIKVGRVLHGFNMLNPFTNALRASLAIGFLSEMEKESRLKRADIIEKKRLEEEQAEEEAYKIYKEAEKVSGGENASVENLKKAYRASLPEDLIQRLSNREDANLTLIQSFVTNYLENSLIKINKQITDIEESTLSSEEKHKRKNAILEKNDNFLKDLNKIVNNIGTIDAVSYGLRLLEKTSKAATTALVVETGIESIGKIWHLFSEYGKEFAFGTGVSGASAEHLTETHSGSKHGLWSSIKNWFSYDKQKPAINPEGGTSEKFARTFEEQTKDKILKTYILEGDKNITEKAFNVDIKHTADGGLVIKQVSDIDGKTTGVKISKEEIDNYIKRTEDLKPQIAERFIKTAEGLAENNQNREDLIKMWIMDKALDKETPGLSFHEYSDKNGNKLFKMEITRGINGEPSYYHMEIDGVTQNEILRAKTELNYGEFPESFRKALEAKSHEVNKKIPPELKPKSSESIHRSSEIGVGPDDDTHKYPVDIKLSELSPLASSAAHSAVENLNSSSKSGITPPTFSSIEHFNYQGGKSVWKEADLQLKERFKELFNRLGNDNQKTAEALKTYNIDRLKDVIVKNPTEYGLPKNFEPTKMTKKILEGINWDKAFHDAFPKNNLTENLSPEKINNILENNASQKEKLFSSESTTTSESKIIPAPPEIENNIISGSNNMSSNTSAEIPSNSPTLPVDTNEINGIKVEDQIGNQEIPLAPASKDISGENKIEVGDYIQPSSSNPIEALREKNIFINDIDKFAKQVGFKDSNSEDFRNSLVELSNLDIHNIEEAREIMEISHLSDLPVETIGKHLDFALNPDLDEKTSSNIIKLLENNRDKISIRFFNKNYPGRVSSVELVKLRDYHGKEMENLRVYYTGVVRGGHDAILRINNKEFFIERDGLSVKHPLHSLKNFFKYPDKFIFSAKRIINKAA